MEETKVPCGVCVKCIREAKEAQEESNPTCEWDAEAREFDRIYGDLLNHDIPDDCPLKDLGKYSCSAKRLAELVDKQQRKRREHTWPVAHGRKKRCPGYSVIKSSCQ
jgi:hypothetical protein